MEFCCHFWASTLHYYLLMLKKMQKWVFSSKLPAYHQNLGSFNLFHRFHFGKYSLNSHAYSEPCHTSKTKRLAKIVPAHPLTVFANVSSYIFDERVLNTPFGTRWLLLLLLLLTSRRISSMIWSNIKTDKINKISSMTWQNIKTDKINDMIKYVRIIDKFPQTPLNKISIVQVYVFNKLQWRLAIYDLTETWVDKNIDKIILKFLRKWCQLPVCANVEHLSIPLLKLGVNFKSAKVCCIFSEHLFIRTPLDGCFCFI